MVTYVLLAVFAIVIARTLFARRGDISGPQAQALVKAGARLLDVRSPEEFSGQHLPGAVNLPLPALADKLSTLAPKDAPIVVYCQSGMRSAHAVKLLKANGFSQVHNLGGLGNW
ncbi:MAG: rhodanese-like domain-containing protein [Deltaproteobacteria bacterium]|nr:rhodanese-like domain-containing protein [Deltaproteobacteria bacterium]